MRSPALISHKRALLRLKCPRCHTGDLFVAPATSLRHFDEMPTHCPVCRQTYEPEPGFYYGAMYISYGFSVLLVVVVGVVLYFLAGDPPVWAYVATVTGSVVLLTPLFYRYARAVMLYAFGSAPYSPAADPARSDTARRA